MITSVRVSVIAISRSTRLRTRTSVGPGACPRSDTRFILRDGNFALIEEKRSRGAVHPIYFHRMGLTVASKKSRHPSGIGIHQVWASATPVSVGYLIGRQFGIIVSPESAGPLPASTAFATGIFKSFESWCFPATHFRLSYRTRSLIRCRFVSRTFEGRQTDRYIGKTRICLRLTVTPAENKGNSAPVLYGAVASTTTATRSIVSILVC